MLGYQILLPLFLMLKTVPAPEEGSALTLQFDVFKGKKLIGVMVCNRLESNGLTEYSSETKVQVNLLTDVSVYNKVKAVYAMGMLKNGSFYRMVNNNVKANDKFEWLNDRYIINSQGKTTEFKAAVHYSVCRMMFNEPLQTDRAFSENLKQFVNVKKIASNKYVLAMPDGNDNIYTYQNGKCVEVQVETAMGTLYMKLRN